MTRIINPKIRKAAAGEECTMRLVGICNGNPETTVLAHLPCGQKGTGMKGPDTVAVFACSACHERIDGAHRWEIDAADYLRALGETHTRLAKKGIL